MNTLTLKPDSAPPTAPGKTIQRPAESGLLEKIQKSVKGLVKRLPFFPALDFYRRKLYDSPLFDFTVQPLAEKLADWPRVLLIDNTNSCNAKCVWCPNPDLTNLGVMKMDLYKKIIDDYATRGGRIRFGTFGEPLLDKTLGEKILYAKSKPTIADVEVLTNAYFLNEKIVPVLLEQRVGVEVSLDELDKKTFEDVKKMSYDVVRKNIVAFLEANERLSNPVPVNFRIKTLKTAVEAQQHEFFKELLRHRCTLELTPINDDIITNWAGKFDKNSFFDEYATAPTADPFNYKQYNLANTAPCVQLWKWLVIYWDGSVVLCCVDMFATTQLGNLRDKSIGEIWSGPELTGLRRSMADRRRFDTPLCRNCDIHLSWHNLKEYYDADGNLHPHLRFIS
jgi:radical SAM protein with 4Fe4S-binding SPASM domain